MQKGPSYSSSAATYPEKSAKAQSRKSVSMRACAFFSPRLNPVLDRGQGHKDTVVSPQMPTRRAVGQAVFNHDAHRQIDHAVGIMTAWWCQISEVGVQVLATFRTVMLRIRDDKIPRTPHVEMAQVVQRPMRRLVPIGRVTTTRTRLPRVVATVQDDLGLRQVCERCHTFGRVGAIRTWAEHRVARLAQKLGPELYDKGLVGATRYPRYSLLFASAAAILALWLRPPVPPRPAVLRPPSVASA